MASMGVLNNLCFYPIDAIKEMVLQCIKQHMALVVDGK